MLAVAPLRVLLLLASLFLLSSTTRAENAASSDNSSAAESDSRQQSTRAKRPSARERAASRRAARDSASKAKSEEERTKWLARLKARNVEPWPESETDDEHAAALAKSRKMVDEVIGLFPGTQLYETDHFLVVSSMPAEQVRPYAASVDRMYEWMCRMYGVPGDHKVWLGGKAPIYAFLEKEDFDNFEGRYFPEALQTFRTLANVYGLSHLSPSGEVVIACYRGNDPHDFGQMLVHETSHGFIHRYKTKASLPNWVDEGMADLIGAEMVPGSSAVKNRELKAAHQVAQQRSLGGMLAAERIEPWQYGVASSLNRFLLQANRQAYVRFIESLKEGMKWEEALSAAYRSTPEDMLGHYGRWIGVADLKP